MYRKTACHILETPDPAARSLVSYSHRTKERYGALCLLRLLSHILYRIASFSYGVLTKNTVNLLYEERRPAGRRSRLLFIPF